MDAAALLLLASAVGVGFGWQPMPDGTPRSEYIVHVEPEMLKALANGASIPIVSDVPADADPIARVRIVVGRGELPREQAVTRLKPVADDGVVLTQYAEQAAPRYGAPAAVASAPAGTTAPTYDPYTGVPPTVSAGGGSWNNEAAPATGAPAVAAGSTWNGGGAPAVVSQDLPSGPLPRLRAGLQQATEPLQQGIESVGDGLRTAGQNIQGRTGRMMDELRGIGSPAAATTTAPGWNGGAAATDPAGVAGVSGGVAPQSSGWNNGAGTTADAGSAPSYTPPYGSAAPPYVPGTATTGAANAEPWSNTAGQSPTEPTTTGTSTGTTTWPGSGPDAGATVLQPPPLTMPSATSGQGSPPWGNSTTGTVTPGPGTPAIDANMLALPSDRTLEGATAGLGGASLPPLTDPFAPAAGNPATGGNASLPTTPSWVNGGTAPSTTPTTATSPTSTAATPATAKNPGQQAAVVFAWVTLFASAAGNIYLFWSYLDVRTKYRALVRKTARAVGSRFSAA